MRTLQAGAAGHDGDARGQVWVAGGHHQRQAAAEGVAHDCNLRRLQLGADFAHERWDTRCEKNSATNKTALVPF